MNDVDEARKRGDAPVAVSAGRREWEALGLALLTGLLYGLPFAVPPLGALAWVAFVPMVSVYALPRWRRGDKPAPLGPAVVTSMVALLLGTSLPISALSPVAGLVHPLFYLPFPVAAFWAMRRLFHRTRLPATLVLPLTWVSAEFLWSYYSLGAQAFQLIGLTQYESRILIQFADVTGVLGVSLLVCLVNGAIVDVLRARATRDPGHARAARLAARVTAGLVLAALAYGLVRDHDAPVTAGPRLALVQPNLPHGFSDYREVHARQMAMVLERIAPGDCDLVALPENALQDYVQNPGYIDDFGEVTAKVGAPLLLGANGVPPEYRNGQPLPMLAAGHRPVANEAILIGTDGRVLGEVFKMHLMPWTEAVPFAETIGKLSPSAARGLRKFTESVLGFAGSAVPGKELLTLKLPTQDGEHEFWVPICFESADARLAREGAAKGSEFFVNITSEGLLGKQIYWNMLAICTFRAVENRVGIARATNTGISCFIGPDGRIGPLLVGDRGSLYNDSGVLVRPIGIDARRPTLYTRLGDWLPWTCLVASLALLVGTLRRRGGAGAP